MQMDRHNKVHTFEELGLCDPFHTRKSLKDAHLEIRTFDFYTEVYPSSVMEVILEAIKYK